jgi:hypothetical protein
MNESTPRKKPFGVTLLLWMVLILITWGGVRFHATLRWWNVVEEFDSSLSPLYLSVTGAGWSVVGCVLLWSILTSKEKSPQAVLTSIMVWLIEYWAERMFFQTARANLVFALVSSAIMVIIVVVSALHKSTREFFKKKRGV